MNPRDKIILFLHIIFGLLWVTAFMSTISWCSNPAMVATATHIDSFSFYLYYLSGSQSTVENADCNILDNIVIGDDVYTRQSCRTRPGLRTVITSHNNRPVFISQINYLSFGMDNIPPYIQIFYGNAYFVNVNIETIYPNAEVMEFNSQSIGSSSQTKIYLNPGTNYSYVNKLTGGQILLAIVIFIVLIAAFIILIISSIMFFRRGLQKDYNADSEMSQGVQWAGDE